MRLIDADVMREDWLENGQNEFVYDTNSVLYSIDAQPTVDAVEVVRCKDCKYGIKSHLNKTIGEFYLCRRQDTYWKPNDFCSYGERKDNGC